MTHDAYQTDPGQNLREFTRGRKFRTILADPPWQFQNRTGKIAPEHRRLNRYSTMDLDQICELPVAEIAEIEGIDPSQVHRQLRLTLLAPDVVEKLVAQPGLTAEKVLGRPWPSGWQEQMRLLA